MSILETLKLVQFHAAYNLPVHVGIETGIFASHGLTLEIAYTPGSLYTTQALNDGRFDIGHTGADDVIAAVEGREGADLFLFMGLHGGLFSLIAAPDISSMDALINGLIGVDAKTSGFALVLESALRARGFARQDIQLIEIGAWDSRYRALMEGKISATLLTEPFVNNALAAGCNLLARDFEMIPTYQGTCAAATRRWAAQHGDRLVRYVRAYVEATRWCFARNNRSSCLDILARHNEIVGPAGERTLDALLNPEHGLYPNAAPNLSGINAALELRAGLGYLARPISPVEKYVDLSYYRQALSIGA